MATREQRRTLLAALQGLFVTSFPVVVLVAALPDIAEDLGTTAATLAWVISAPMLTGSVSLPLFGRLGDLHGHRRVFLIGYGMCGLTAGLTALAWDPLSLVVLRTISQTIGMATMPTALALIMATFPGPERPRALGHWSFVGAAAPAMGLIFGGPLIAVVTWRGLFALQALLVLVSLPRAFSVLPETPRKPSVRFDIPGAATLVLTSGAAVFALDRIGPWGPTHPGVLLAIALFPLGLLAVRTVERRAEDPLLPLYLVRRASYVAPVASEFIFQISSTTAFFLAPILLAERFGYDVGTTAFLLLPLPLGMAALSPVGGRLTAALGARRVSVAGGLLQLCSGVVLLVGYQQRMTWVVVAAFVLQGAANGLARPAFATAATAALEGGVSVVGMATMRMVSSLGAAGGVSTAIGTRALGGFGAAIAAVIVAAVLASALSLLVDDTHQHLESGALAPS